MVAGIFINAAENNSRISDYKSASAATLPQINPEMFSRVQLPLDLQLDQAKHNSSALDTVYITKTDTIEKQVPKVKWKRKTVPYPVVKTDTLYVPIYYLATQVGNKEGPTGECVSVYELQKVNEICPENTNSSASHTPQCENDIGD